MKTSRSSAHTLPGAGQPRHSPALRPPGRAISGDHLQSPADRPKQGAGQRPGTTSRRDRAPRAAARPRDEGGAAATALPALEHNSSRGLTGAVAPLTQAGLPPPPAAAGPRFPPRSSGTRSGAPYLRAGPPQPRSPRPPSPPAVVAAGGRELAPSQRAGPGRCRPPARCHTTHPGRAAPRLGARVPARPPFRVCARAAAAPPAGLGPPPWRSSCSAGRWSPPNGSRRPCAPGGRGAACGCWTPPGTRRRTEMPGRSSRRGTFPARPSSTSRSAETWPPPMTSCCPVSPTLPTTWGAWGSATTPTWWCTTATSWAPSTPPVPGGCSGPSGTSRSRC